MSGEYYRRGEENRRRIQQKARDNSDGMRQRSGEIHDRWTEDNRQSRQGMERQYGDSRLDTAAYSHGDENPMPQGGSLDLMTLWQAGFVVGAIGAIAAKAVIEQGRHKYGRAA